MSQMWPNPIKKTRSLIPRGYPTTDLQYLWWRFCDQKSFWRLLLYRYHKFVWCNRQMRLPIVNWKKSFLIQEVLIFKNIVTYRVSQKKIPPYEVIFLKFYELLRNQSFCIGKRKGKLKSWGVIYQIWFIRPKIMPNDS